MFGLVLSPLEKAGGALLIIVLAFFGFKLWLATHDANVRQGYVLEAEKTAAVAQAAEMERQRNAASQALDDAEKRRAADEITQQAQDALTQAQVQQYEVRLAADNRQCPLSRSDIDFILQH